ncbi:hypothetical protein [Nonlabens sp. Hel1_33_55]|nr:hypothetical protein [Nonlabens sp. Hel1_33_55]
MENREWRMENGEWRMENGEWRMENGEWRIYKFCYGYMNLSILKSLCFLR